MSNVIVSVPEGAKCDVDLTQQRDLRRHNQELEDIEKTWLQINRDNVIRNNENADVRCVSCWKFLRKNSQNVSDEHEEGFVCDYVRSNVNYRVDILDGKKTKVRDSMDYDFVCSVRGCKHSINIDDSELSGEKNE
jgi:hypothetical protein